MRDYTSAFMTVLLMFQIVFLKGRNDVFNAKVAIDDVELTGCDLHLPSSECSEVRCGNGVSYLGNIL